jgi:hypothetical protein
VQVQPRQQLARMERLLHDVAGAGAQQPRHALGIALPGEEQERHLLAARASALGRQQLLAVEARHLEVADHGVHGLREQHA